MSRRGRRRGEVAGELDRGGEECMLGGMKYILLTAMALCLFSCSGLKNGASDSDDGSGPSDEGNATTAPEGNATTAPEGNATTAPEGNATQP